MTAPDEHLIGLDVRVDTEEERAALEQALLRARATELTEVRRREVRLAAGYGDPTTRDAMTAEGQAARLRHTMLDRLLAALRDAAAPPTRAGEP
jgi:hypothetical protein